MLGRDSSIEGQVSVFSPHQISEEFLPRVSGENGAKLELMWHPILLVDSRLEGCSKKCLHLDLLLVFFFRMPSALSPS